MAGRGEACYFPRDLAKGSYGGDVHCFQQYLSHKGYLLDEPTGYFGERTATATRRWQRDNGISGDDAGDFGEWSRERYAATHGLPLPSEGRIFKDAKSDEVREARFAKIFQIDRLPRASPIAFPPSPTRATHETLTRVHLISLLPFGPITQKNTCVDVCAEFTGVQDCQTRCVRDPGDKKHACLEACQTAFSTACDRAFPASGEGGSTNFKICLSYLQTSCEDTCKKFRA